MQWRWGDGEVLGQARQIDEAIDPPQQVTARDIGARPSF
jgi:hypothetical protein